ncbi:MAG: hypothetical protein KatS3mg131_1881 [Candidatus Tectimicrobiota bacterium]|nr:MAG: hypothetical protein KatS3mg131_1881 [Candidatus Tectomicrobia bacterium]
MSVCNPSLLLEPGGSPPQGFTLVEVVIAMSLGLALLAGTYGFYTGQRKALATRELVAEMQQQARIGMAMLVRELRMAGYDPTGTAGAGIVEATATAIRFTMDRNGDGDTNDANEDVRYTAYDSGGDGDLDLGRRLAASTNQPVAENLQELHFAYILADGTTTDAPADPGQIRAVQITLVARTAKPDPAYPGGYRTYTLRSAVVPRNLALR